MLKKVILLAVSLLFLFGGGLCSIFLIKENVVWKISAATMMLLCTYTFLAVLYWLSPFNKTNLHDKKPKAPTILVIVTVTIVSSIYALCWSGILNIRIAG